MPQVLNLKKGEVAVAAVLGHQMIMRLAQLVEADTRENSAARGRVSDDISSRLSDEFTSEFVQYLRMQHPPKINAELLDTLRQEGS